MSANRISLRTIMVHLLGAQPGLTLAAAGPAGPVSPRPAQQPPTDPATDPPARPPHPLVEEQQTIPGYYNPLPESPPPAARRLRPPAWA